MKIKEGNEDEKFTKSILTWFVYIYMYVCMTTTMVEAGGSPASKMMKIDRFFFVFSFSLFLIVK